MQKNYLRMIGIVIALAISGYCFYANDTYEDILLSENPKAVGGRYTDKISLHQSFIPATPDQGVHHLLLELGAYGGVLIAGLILVSRKSR